MGGSSVPSQARRSVLWMSLDDPTTLDPDGRLVILDERTIGHLQSRRPQMIQHAAAILDAVSLPDHHEEDPSPGRERFYRRDLDPHRWLRAVVGMKVKCSGRVGLFCGRVLGGCG
jgi:hypothetical protein